MIFDKIKYSNALQREVRLKVVLPNHGSCSKIMILLHGTMNERKCSEIFEYFPQELKLQELCDTHGMAVVIPLMENRYYISTEDYDCKRFISEELPAYMKEQYEIPDSAEVILAGISMGGYGAVLIGAQSGKFQKIISVSGAFITEDIQKEEPEVWGTLKPDSPSVKYTFLHYFLPLENLEKSRDRNALAALELCLERTEQPQFIVTCGMKDWLYERNLKFLEALKATGMRHQFYSLEGGDHNAECFIEGLRKALEA